MKLFLLAVFASSALASLSAPPEEVVYHPINYEGNQNLPNYSGYQTIYEASSDDRITYGVNNRDMPSNGYPHKYDSGRYENENGRYGAANGNKQNGYYSSGNPPYDDNYSPKPDFLKLKKLRLSGVPNAATAKITYLTRGNNNYAVVSCPRNPDTNGMTAIVVDADENVPNYPPETMPIALGVSPQALVKLGKKKYESKNIIDFDKSKFKRVACVHFPGSEK
ncbi:unnamed protein product [Caenorhabditis bovis]|uniref:Uncharacterized protein n=1 Tax=Caenorhabditis bovis TaxID=2654633 RepID=A0A8S1EI91_9PELO|nr:unnamed protein product [Caenorhabditis bovis]